MRHGGGALLLFAEVFLGLAHFGLLQMPDLGGELVQRGCNNGQSRDVKGVPVALNDLRGNGGHVQAKALADLFLVLRLQVGGIADGAADLADAHLLGGKVKALEVAPHLGIPVREFQAEGDGLGVDAVRTADHGRVL